MTRLSPPGSSRRDASRLPAPGGLVAIVGDDAPARGALRALVERAGFRAVELERGPARVGLPPDVTVVCLDLRPGFMAAMDVLRHVHGVDPDLPVVAVAGDDDPDRAVEVRRAGAWDLVVAPVREATLVHALERAAQRRALGARVRSLTRALDAHRAAASLVGDSAAVRELRREIQLVAGSDVAVCLLGEAGVGQEEVARAIHAASARAGGPFVALDVGAVAAAQQEPALFGPEPGGPGVHRGRLERAHGGTLFVDDVGALTAATQARLVRALEEGAVRRPGGGRGLPIDVRLVSATRGDVEGAGALRPALRGRLTVHAIHVPPLRDRLDDVAVLAAALLHRHARDGAAPPRIAPDAVEALVRYRWPGNVRELQQVLHRAVLASGGDEVRLDHLPAALHDGTRPSGRRSSEATTGPAVLPMHEVERDQIVRALAATGGNRTRAARLLGIGRATLYRRLGELAPSGDLGGAPAGADATGTAAPDGSSDPDA